MLENEGIPLSIPRNRTYAEVESYLSDLLSVQDSKLRHQPNAVHNQADGQGQLAALTALRAIMHNLIRPETRGGPFYLALTDMAIQNIFIDEDWNVQTIIDLECAHSLPAEMDMVPFWLTSRAVDGFERQEEIAEYEPIVDEYLAIYEAEEKKRNGTVNHASVMRQVWKSGSFWYFHALAVPKGMYNLFNWHIQPLFHKEQPTREVFDEVFYWYWGFEAQDVIDKKLKIKEEYLVKVRKAVE